ncbi:DivIVA domain-containing protein, partial [Thermodesulfitimonas sp.]
MSEDLERQLESARFRRTLLGYAPREVDALLEKATQALKRLEQEKKHLEQVVAGYRAQEENLRAALLRAEETARRAREEAKHEATVLRAEAQVEARRLLAEAQEEYRRLEEERKR